MVLALQFQSLQLFQQEEIHFCSNFKVSKMLPVGSQIVAHTLIETGNGPNRPNTIDL